MEDRAFNKAIRKATGISIKKTQKVSNNKVFRKIADKVIEHFSSYLPIMKTVKVFLREMNTIVQTPKGGVLKIHDSLDFIFLDGSVIRYSSMGKDGLELTRIQVSKQSRGKGLGTDIMELTLSLFEEVLGYTVHQCLIVSNLGEITTDNFRKRHHELIKGTNKVQK